jgi:hypothetical protein
VLLQLFLQLWDPVVLWLLAVGADAVCDLAELGLEELLDLLGELLRGRVLARLGLFEVLTSLVLDEVTDENMVVQVEHLTLGLGFKLEVVVFVRSRPDFKQHGDDHIFLLELLDIEDTLGLKLEFGLVVLLIDIPVDRLRLWSLDLGLRWQLLLRFV